MANIGYIRVSTKMQNTDRQQDALNAIGMDKLFIDKESGASAARPELKEMMKYLREGDTLYVQSIDRLARNTKDLLHIVETLSKENVQIVFLKENIDTSTPIGQFLLTVFAAMADLERKNILERQREGYEAARKRGRTFGRPRKALPDNAEEIFTLVQQKKMSKYRAIRVLSMSSATFHRRYNEWLAQIKSK